MKKIKVIVTIILIIIGGFGIFYISQELRKDQSTEDSSATNINVTVEYQNIKSVTYYVFPGSINDTYKNLSKDIVVIKSRGFNTIWIVIPWIEINPKPFEGQYDQGSIDTLKSIITLAKSNEMKIILGLNYLGEGWAPAGIDACHWIENKEMYNAFVNYVKRMMEELLDYKDSLYLLVFTENSEPCNMKDITSAEEVAALLRTTLGDLPNQLPQELRSQYKIGYHDYNLINLNWAKGSSPVQNPISFDFLSMVAYGFDFSSEAEINQELTIRMNRFKALYPGIPLIIGESGISICNVSLDIQKEKLVKIISFAEKNNLGINIWGWRTNLSYEEECVNNALFNLGLTNRDGSFRPAAYVIKAQSVECGSIDSNNDNRLTLLDLGAFIKIYGNSCSNEPPTTGCKGKDTNLDGMVNLIDLANFVNRYDKDNCGL